MTRHIESKDELSTFYRFSEKNPSLLSGQKPRRSQVLNLNMISKNPLKTLESFEDSFEKAKRTAQELSDRVLTGIATLRAQRNSAATEAAKAYAQYQAAQKEVEAYDLALADLKADLSGLRWQADLPSFFYFGSESKNKGLR